MIKRIQEGLAQAQQNEFVPDEDMDAFFTRHAESQTVTINQKLHPNP
jgi:hypothetical protein